ncbi:unnamed protein product [Rotaria sordida]|uniref:Major facilitator superfamily associated domain-containing protein n=1 Tax=Rotaria sordida TaxID=392033 RepID=A0A813Q8E0_9BILA|nr:unnamed protein product [Rotaria sordida]
MESPSMLAPTTNVVSASSSLPFVHRYYVLLKAHYFLFFSAFGILYPILNITLRGRGLSTTEISYANLIIPFLVFFTNPLLGFVADRSRRYLLTFNCIIIIITCLYSILFILPTIKSNYIQATIVYDNQLGHVLDFCASEEVATKCSSRSECGCSYTSLCQTTNSPFNFTFTMSSKDTRQPKKSSIDTSEFSTCGIQYRVPVDKFIHNYTSHLYSNIDNTSLLVVCEITCSITHFCHGTRQSQQALYILLYALLFIVGTNLLSIGITIGASIGFATLPRPDIFGEQRVWGTIGFGLSAFAASRIYAHYKTEYVYIIMFSITTIICICVTSFIRIQPHKRRRKKTNDNIQNNEQEIDDISVNNITIETKNKDASQFKVAALIPLLKKIDVIVFLSLTFIWGMSYAALDPYLYLYIDEIAPCQSHVIVGWMSMISASAEVIALFLASRMLRLLGMNTASIIILIAFAIRFAGYYFIRRPYFLLIMETMHYFNFGILYVLIAQKADSIAPPGLAGTLQGVVYGVSFGLGRGIGLIASSIIYTRLQSRLLFLVFALFDTIAALIYSTYFLLQAKFSKKSAQLNNTMNIPKIVIESETIINEEPLLISSSTNKIDNKIIEQ